jgi:hypothetical protein
MKLEDITPKRIRKRLIRLIDNMGPEDWVKEKAELFPALFFVLLIQIAI